MKTIVGAQLSGTNLLFEFVFFIPFQSIIRIENHTNRNLVIFFFFHKYEKDVEKGKKKI